MPNLLRALWCPRNGGEVSHRIFRFYDEEIPEIYVDLAKGFLVFLEISESRARIVSK